ncbi:ComF family protein [bacterium]|nr:ComF family protein [bacterium]
MGRSHTAEVLYRGFWTVLDWIYPPVCVGCGEPGYRLCDKCFGTIRFIEGHVCERCGLPIGLKRLHCEECDEEKPPYDAMRSLARYEGVIRESIHALKYGDNLSLGEVFTDRLTAIVREEDWSPDLIIPVPLSPARKAQRGYNQSTLLARPVALQLGVRFTPEVLRRIRNTQSQVELPADKRRENVKGAFNALPELVSGKRVLLVDDVTTTGSTIKECALALREVGAAAVYCLTLARPIH